MKFKIAFSIYLVICLLYPTIPIFGSISIRHIFTLIMLIWCALEKGVYFDKFQKWFAIFLFFSFLSSTISGYFASFANSLAGTYLATFVMYWSTKIVINKYNGVKWIISIILVIAVINGLTAIGQFYGNPIATFLPQILRVNIGEDMLEFYERFDDFHGRYVGGLLGIVSSGYFLCGACVLSLFNMEGKKRIYNWLLFAFLFFALFLVQERSGLVAAILGTAVFLLINVSQRKSIIWGVAAISLVLIAVLNFNDSMLLNISEMRYSVEGFDYDRLQLASNGWRFFLSDPMGGIEAYHEAGNRDPHLIFVLVFLYGGLLGGLVAIGILISQMVKVFRILYESYFKKNHSNALIVFSIVYLCYTINSFVHNASLFTGDIMFFVLWAVVVALREKEAYTIKNVGINGN